MSNLIGKSLGRYQILEQLGEGGMAIVYKAYDTRLEREVAIKMLRSDAFPPEHLGRILKRFEREMETLAKLSHPNIVKIHDYGEHNGLPNLVLEYFPGGTLKQRLGKQIPWQETTQLIIPIADALRFAHERHVVHRDVKPSNILLTRKGIPMLTDFGIAKILEAEGGQTLTATTSVGIGTPEYMAPEQGLGQEVDVRADVYSLGIVFYEMVTGRKPFRADTPMAVIVKHINEPLPRPAQFVPDLPKKVENMLSGAVAKKREDRYDSMVSFRADLEGLLDDKKNTGLTIKRQQLVKKNNKYPIKSSGKNKVRLTSNRSLLAIIFVVIILVLGGISFSRYFLGPDPESHLIDPGQTTTKQTSEPTKSMATITPQKNSQLTTSTPAPSFEIDSSAIRLQDGMEMVYIPTGEFYMGSDDGQPNERLVHVVHLDAFWNDQTEVTISMYKKCTDSGVCRLPSDDANYRSRHFDTPLESDYPITNISWQDAKSYCEWVESRLPTEAEWEKAARGGLEDKRYPWGDELPSCEEGAVNGIGGEALCKDVSPVGSFAKNGYGLYDMAGNVWEWVSDWYDSSYYDNSPEKMPTGPKSGSLRVIRSSSSLDMLENIGQADALRISVRLGMEPNSTNPNVGFRCVRNESP